MLEEIKKSLKPEEIILWSGKANAKKMISYGDYMYIPFSLMWCAFVVYWEWLSIKFEYPIVFHVLGVPMALIGLYMAFGRFVYKYFKKKNSCYCITNLRVIEAYEKPIFGYKEMAMADIGRVVRFVEKDGHGTLVFNDVNPAYIMKLNDGMEMFRSQTRKLVGFYDVPDVETLFELTKTYKGDQRF